MNKKFLLTIIFLVLLVFILSFTVTSGMIYLILCCFNLLEYFNLKLCIGIYAIMILIGMFFYKK